MDPTNPRRRRWPVGMLVRVCTHERCAAAPARPAAIDEAHCVSEWGHGEPQLHSTCAAWAQLGGQGAGVHTRVAAVPPPPTGSRQGHRCARSEALCAVYCFASPCRLPARIPAAGGAAKGVPWGEGEPCLAAVPGPAREGWRGRHEEAEEALRGRYCRRLGVAPCRRRPPRPAPACKQVPVIAATATATGDVRRSIVSESAAAFLAAAAPSSRSMGAAVRQPARCCSAPHGLGRPPAEPPLPAPPPPLLPGSLKLQSPLVLHGSFNRPNIALEVRGRGDGPWPGLTVACTLPSLLGRPALCTHPRATPPSAPCVALPLHSLACDGWPGCASAGAAQGAAG